tara:strand:- start:452 stop:643 length:192 start_codon:yes stop_codon:yes gene_type:complete
MLMAFVDVGDEMLAVYSGIALSILRDTSGFSLLVGTSRQLGRWFTIRVAFNIFLFWVAFPVGA